MLGRATLTVPASPSTAVIAEAVVTSFAYEAGIPAEGVERLQRALRCLVAFSVEQSYEGRGGGDVEISLELDAEGVALNVHDWGKPFRRAGGPGDPLPPGLEEAEAVAADVRLINLANEGKRLSLHIATEHAIVLSPAIDGAADLERASRSQTTDGIEIRDATIADATAISQLMYRSYGLGYVHADFYRPVWVEAAMNDGHVSSTVAYAGDELIGHHALLITTPHEAAESGVAVVAREWRGLGLFDQMFERTVARAKALGIPAMFGQATTAHVYSQRSEFKSGYRPTALMIGAAPAAMAQAQGSDGAEPVGRGALLNSVLPLAKTPRIHVALPALYADVLQRIANNAGLEIVAPQDAVPLELSEDIAFSKEGLSANIYVSGGADPQRLERMLWSDDGRRAETLYADLDLTCDCEAALHTLRSQGFYLSGLIHAGRDGRDWLRLQRPQAQADLEQLHVEGDFAAWLLDAVLADRASVSSD
ncbi:MAG: hypothetical protein EXQ67_03405 [Thermoleophilia bacterium]|nr:hypothetical protein [Thermoleophilia bacterium]